MCREVAKLEFGPRGRDMYVPPNVAEVMRLLLESRVLVRVAPLARCSTDSRLTRTLPTSLFTFQKIIKRSPPVGQQLRWKEAMRQT